MTRTWDSAVAAFEESLGDWTPVEDETLDPWANVKFEPAAEGKHGPCGSCGHDPACGFASITVDDVETWLCHSDDGADAHSCYANAGQERVAQSVANTRSEVWYGKSEGGEVVEAHGRADGTALPFISSASAAQNSEHTTRCSCAGCLASRAALRERTMRDALRPKNGPSGAWSDRSWDGPLAEFPGHSHSDEAER